MKTVSEAYNRVIVSDVINDTIRGSIDGELFNINDLVSLKISQKGTSGNDLQIGGVFSQQMTLEMFYDETADGDYKKYNGSIIGLSYHVKLPEAEEYEPCALNLFAVTQAERLSQTVILTAYDMMINLEKRYDGWDDISHDLYDWYTKICHDCQVTAGMTENEFKALANISSVGAVNIKPGGVFATYRDIAHHIAVLIGGYAFIRGSSLYFAEYKNRSPVLTIPVNLIDDGDKFSDYSVRFTTVSVQHDNTLISATLDSANGREYSLGELPLLEDFGDDGVYQTVVNNILTNLSTIEYIPFELKWTGNPALECGDFVAIEGMDIISPVTSIDWAFDEMETLKAVGSEQDIVQNATSSAGTTTSKEINQVKQTFYGNLQNYATKDDVANIGLQHLLDGSADGSLRSDTSAKETDDYKLPYDAITLGYNNKSESGWCAAISGSDNEIDSFCRYSAIYAGAYNKLAGAYESVINGGYFNSIDSGGHYNSISGGTYNKIAGHGSNAISGGEHNKITNEGNGYASFIGGGSFNELSCEYASISGGQSNKLIKSPYSCISGGYYNTIQDGRENVILGGEHNNITNGSYSVILSSSNCTITHNRCCVSGDYLKTSADCQFICGEYNADNSNAVFIVGNGESDSNRSNAFEVLKDGTIIANGKKVPRKFIIELEWANSAEDEERIANNIALLSQFDSETDSLWAMIDGGSDRVPLSAYSGGSYYFDYWDSSRGIWHNYKITVSGDTYTKTYTTH